MVGRGNAVNLFLNALSERHDELNTAVKRLMECLVGEDTDRKKVAAERVAERSAKLQDILPNSDVPRWLKKLPDEAARYVRGGRTAHDLLMAIVGILPEMTTHEWALSETADSALDFDAIFELYRDENRLPELFEKIIEILQGIRDSGDVDSVSMIDALTKVILAMKKGKSGSYLALNGAWSFLVSFLNNYLWAELAKIPVLGTAFEALRKTIEEAGEAMDHLHDSMHEEIVCRVKAEVKLMDKPDLVYLGYTRQGVISSNQQGSKKIGTA